MIFEWIIFFCMLGVIWKLNKLEKTLKTPKMNGGKK